MSGVSPYPGLRSFDRDEADVFFGRDRCLDGMAQTLQDTRFLAVLGPSGSGKSSLVRSGLFMHLEAGLAPKAGSRWSFLDIRHPRTQPFRELALATLDAERRRSAEAGDSGEESAAAADEPGDAELDARRKELRMGPLALARWWRDTPHHPNENLLLLVDQFEELFGYTTPRERDEVEAFIDLLLHTAANAEVDVYVVLTMRSEFLGGCALFPGLAEQINKSLSLTPRMTRDECRSAITGPAYGEALMLEPLLVTTLLNDMNSLAQFDEPAAGEDGAPGEAPAAELRQTDLIARRADQLPLMQHALNWMWTLAAERRRGPDEPIVLSLQDYLALGGLRGALSRHANEVMDSTGDPELTARIFRALTDQPTVATSGSAESSAVRRRRTLAQLAEETGASEDQVRAVVDAFRAEGVSMLTPDPTVRLTSGMEVDITHESLIRQWSDLRGWIRDEAEGGRAWQELLRDVAKGKQLRGLDLAERRGWWERARPHAGWATRYGGEFGTVDTSLAADVRAERWGKLRLRAITLGMVGLAGISFASLAYALAWQRVAVKEARYADVQAQQALMTADRREWLARREVDKAGLARQKALQAASKAREAADAARRQQADAFAAAQRSTQMAARLKQLAQAEVVRAAEIRRRAELMSSHMVGRSYAQLQGIWERKPEEAGGALGDIANDVGLLRDTDPEAFAAIEPELEKAVGDVATYQLDTKKMQKLVDDTHESLAAPGGQPEQRALRLIQAETLLGRAEHLKGRPPEALAAFDRAIATPPAPGGAELRLARAEAEYQRASTLFDQERWREAAEAAAHCLQTLPQVDAQSDAYGSSDTKEQQIRLRTAFGGFRCHSLLAATAETAEEAARESEEAEALTIYSPDTADVSVARAEMAVRWFRRPRGADERDIPSEMVEAILANVADYSGAGANDADPTAVREADVYPLQGLLWTRSGDELVNWFIRGGSTPRVRLGEAMSIMKMTQGQLGFLSRIDTSLAGLTDMVGDTYALHAANWIALEKFADSQNYDSFEAALPGAAEAIRQHWDFLMRSLGERRPDEAALARFAAVRAQAADLVEGARGQLALERYGTLAGTGQNLLQQLCRGDTVPADAGCGRIEAGLAGIGAEGTTLARSLEAAEPRHDREVRAEASVWTDSGGFALGGLDPVPCFDRVKALPSAQRPSRVPQRSAEEGEPPRPCLLRKGRLQYALSWGGQVWLFERDENRKLFVHAGGTQAPRLGGYPVLSVAEGRKVQPNSGYQAGTVVDGRLYLTDSYYEVQGLTREQIAKAEAVWPALRNAPEPAPPAPPAPTP